jgi:hypothetical protein
MRDDLLEGLVIGGTIGLSVVAIRVLLVGEASLAQVLVLAMAGVILCGAQIGLSLRRARFRRPLKEQLDRSEPALRRRRGRKNPFADELTHNWTGLDDRLSTPQMQQPAEDERQGHSRDD